MDNRQELKKPYHFVIYSTGYTIIQTCIPVSVYLFYYNYIKFIWFVFILVNIFPMQIYYCEILEYPYFGILGKTKIPLLALSSLCVDFILCSFIYFNISILFFIISFILGIIFSIYKTIYCEKRDVYSLECNHVFIGFYRFILYTCLSFGPVMIVCSMIVCLSTRQNRNNTMSIIVV